MVPKFEKEGRSCNGVAAVLRTDDNGVDAEEGVHLPPFFYSGKELISIGKWERLVQTEIKRICDLPPHCRGGWVKDTRPKGFFWETDPLTHVPGVGKAFAKIFRERFLIKEVKDFYGIDDDDLPAMAAAVPSKAFTVKKLQTIRNTILTSVMPGRCRHGVIDFREEDNPYLARYGAEEWEEKIAASSTLSKYCCVKTMILHIDRESRAAFQGTKYEGSYFFYHDALTQMTDKRCTAWMREVGIYGRWIKPELGCNDEILAMKGGELKKNTRYKGRPVGNSPELNPLDNSTFRDFRLNLSLNVAATWHLEREDPKKFSLATPKDITDAVRRLWDPVTGTSPTPNRILQDIKRIPDSCFKIVEYGGKIVPGLADRNGHRRESPNGQRIKKIYRDDVTLEELGLHHSILEGVKLKYENEKDNFKTDIEERALLTDATIITTAPANESD